jgi:DNA polymerase-3 subunit epsilon
LAAAQSAEIIEVRLAPQRERSFREPRPHRASEAELARHAEFLATIQSPLWLG